ncbi:unnamed protein product, partial [Polarella glacialis]
MSAVLARNFPASWVAPAALEVLPQKVQSLLQRLGPLEGPPVISQGPSGFQAIARFQNASDARAAVQTLHGFDMRTPAEKQAANFQAPKEGECFSLRIAEEAGAAAGTGGAAAGTGVSAPKAAARKRRLKPNGIFLWPLPPNWGEKDVLLLASPYGSIQRTLVQPLANGQNGALIDYQKDAAASAALAALNGLSLMGAQLRCVMQEEQEPQKPLQQFSIYLDELPMPSLPAQVEPKLDDREVFVTGLPRSAKNEEGAKSALASFGEVEEVFLLRDAQNKATGKAYICFRSHAESLKAIEAIRADGSLKASWSESDRALRGTRGPYGLAVLRHLAGEGSGKLQELRKAAGVAALNIETSDGAVPNDGKATGRALRFVARCPELAQAEECWNLLSSALAKVHETYTREVRGSLVLRGFPASWSEKGL